jgi:hypothetical protein
MEPTKATLTEYKAFITDPQRYGVWSLRIELSERHLLGLSRGLNLEESMTTSRRRYYHPRYGGIGYSRDVIDDRPPLIIPRLFAYLRATIPQKERDSLPELSQSKDQAQGKGRRFAPYRRGYSFYDELLTPPPHLGSAKQRAMAKAAAIYREHFISCRIAPVPENPVKVNFLCRDPLVYFQVAEELPASIQILSPCEGTLVTLQRLLEAFSGDKYSAELTKVFSPENALMEMYLPMFRLTTLSTIIKDRTAAKNVAQSLEEAEEDRFVHSIRAIGIAAEELLVEIFETYLREKAPEAPLGNLITELQSRLQEIVLGAKPIKENLLAVGSIYLGKIIEEEEKRPKPSNSILELLKALQKYVLPPLENIRSLIDENPVLNTKTQKIALFPSTVQRCLSELVILRNRVSHRVERGTSVASVGYIDTAIALRDFVVVAIWWERERSQINYKSNRKTIIQATVKKSKASKEQDAEA